MTDERKTYGDAVTALLSKTIDVTVGPWRQGARFWHPTGGKAAGVEAPRVGPSWFWIAFRPGGHTIDSGRRDSETEATEAATAALAAYCSEPTRTP